MYEKNITFAVSKERIRGGEFIRRKERQLQSTPHPGTRRMKSPLPKPGD